MQPGKRKNIILTGFMGTGKSTVGTLLAEQLGYKFVDTDQFIEKMEGMSVTDIFQKRGETAFRALERLVAKELGEKNSLVIATGGGLMLDHENAESLGGRGKVFCLVASPDEILKRISADDDRPLLQVKNPGERISELLQKRQKGYGRFTQIITTGKTVLQVVDELLDTLQN
ncbi:MAG: shikimate kinase [Deltaproteobacteria bacterium]|nr:shikimate kinase [Deltaproteobacteria bacterium]